MSILFCRDSGRPHKETVQTLHCGIIWQLHLIQVQSHATAMCVACIIMYGLWHTVWSDHRDFWAVMKCKGKADWVLWSCCHLKTMCCWCTRCYLWSTLRFYRTALFIRVAVCTLWRYFPSNVIFVPRILLFSSLFFQYFNQCFFFHSNPKIRFTLCRVQCCRYIYVLEDGANVLKYLNNFEQRQTKGKV